jgi:hypothetical protein
MTSVIEPLSEALARALHPAGRAMTRAASVLVRDPDIEAVVGEAIFGADDVPAGQRAPFVSCLAFADEADPRVVVLHVHAWGRDFDEADRMSARVIALMRSRAGGRWRHRRTEFLRVHLDADPAVVHLATIVLENRVEAM